MASKLLVAFTLVCALACAGAMKDGDELLDKPVIGHFYVFADQVVHVVDPTTLQIVKNITKDSNGLPLTNDGANGGAANKSRTWNDVVRIEDDNRQLYYFVVNEGDVYNSSFGGGDVFSYVSIIDASKQEFVARLQVGARPVHLYAVPQTGEVWVHSDATGDFFVLNIADDLPKTTVTMVPGFFSKPGHGKLLVDNSLFPEGYVSNVNEQFITEVDLADRVRTNSFPYNKTEWLGPDTTVCPGTHSLVYSNASRHAYFECVDQGILEWDTVAHKIVKYHSNTTGYLVATPANDKIMALNVDTSEVTVLQPQSNGVPAEVIYTILVPGNPDAPVFYSNSTGANVEEATDYDIFFPLVADTNKNNIAAAQAVGSDVGAEGYLSKPTDCSYAVGSSTNTSGLALATAANGTTLTPFCGSCAAGVTPLDAKQWDASRSGMRWTTFGKVEEAALAGTDAVAELIPAGAIYLRPAGGSTSNKCSYAEAHRKISRGGPYIATVVDFPQPSIYVIDATAPKGPTPIGYTATATNPKKVRWMPVHTPASVQSSSTVAGR